MLFGSRGRAPSVLRRHGYGFRINLLPQATDASFETAAAAARQQVVQLIGSTIPITFGEQAVAAPAATRQSGTSPFIMGGGIYWSTGACSSGVPVKYLSTGMMMTAGHCKTHDFYNGGNYVGTTHTILYPAQAHRWSDWQLVSGSTYAKSAFNGGASSTSTLPISGANWGPRSNGLELCSSGVNGGQICRYFVNSNGWTATYDGNTIYPLIKASHRDDFVNDDRNGFVSGDSGGTSYYADGQGGVVAMGIDSGGTMNTTGPKGYFFTPMRALRLWDLTLSF